MKLSMPTIKLQAAVAKAEKGASRNKNLPLTSLMAISVSDGTMMLTTTDATNYLYVSVPVDGDDFYVVVQVDIFAKLIAKLTCDTVQLELKNDTLIITGNGKYTIELPLDENGDLVVYPNPVESFEGVDEYIIPTAMIQQILTTAKPALASGANIPADCYTGYYIQNSVVATDTNVICQLDTPMFTSPKLISPEMMDLLGLFTEEITVLMDDENAMFYTDDCTVYGPVMDCIEDYQIDVIKRLLDVDFDYECSVSKSDILRLLDRLSLFVGEYDKNSVYLTFAEDGILVSSKKSNGTELIKYMSNSRFSPFSCAIDIDMLRSQIKANTADEITIQYGKENAIKMRDVDMTQVVALMQE